MSGYRVDVEALHQHAGQVRRTKQSADTALDAAEQVSGIDLNLAFGIIGQPFGVVAQTASVALLLSIRKLSDALGSAAGKVDLAATRYRGTDETATTDLNTIGRSNALEDR